MAEALNSCSGKAAVRLTGYNISLVLLGKIPVNHYTVDKDYNIYRII